MLRVHLSNRWILSLMQLWYPSLLSITHGLLIDGTESSFMHSLNRRSFNIILSWNMSGPLAFNIVLLLLESFFQRIRVQSYQNSEYNMRNSTGQSLTGWTPKRTSSDDLTIFQTLESNKCSDSSNDKISNCDHLKTIYIVKRRLKKKSSSNSVKRYIVIFWMIIAIFLQTTVAI